MKRILIRIMNFPIFLLVVVFLITAYFFIPSTELNKVFWKWELWE